MSAVGSGPVLALSGGIGGAKLALGLSHVLAPGALTVLANTGDDFEHLGLAISPDIDTLIYTLAGINNPETGWGRADETWNFMQATAALGSETWFRLGDKDLALHIERTRRLRSGDSLSDITADFTRALGARARILPMSDARVRTRVCVAEGWLDFQDYFVRQRCIPRIFEIAFEGATAARPSPGLLHLMQEAPLRAIVICPSNPFISIDPILAVPEMRDLIERNTAPVVAVSPIIGGQAVKGPTAKMMAELGLPVSSATVAQHYGTLIDAYVADIADAGILAGLDVPVTLTPTLMHTLEDRIALARTVLAVADGLAVR
jgi:LPPG:FO 2-phospho-L-lactate transferase